MILVLNLSTHSPPRWQVTREKEGSLATLCIPRRVSRPTSGGGLRRKGPSPSLGTWSRLPANVVRRHGVNRKCTPERPFIPRHTETGRVRFSLLSLSRPVLRAQDLGEISCIYVLGESTDLIDRILGFHLRYRHVESGPLDGGSWLLHGLMNSPQKLDVPQPGHHPGRSPLEA